MPILDNEISQKVQMILRQVQSERARYLQFQIVRHQLDPYLEVEFGNFLTEDQNHDGMTYVDYLCYIHRLV